MVVHLTPVTCASECYGIAFGIRNFATDNVTKKARRGGIVRCCAGAIQYNPAPLESRRALQEVSHAS
jgi:hypothetical protein